MKSSLIEVKESKQTVASIKVPQATIRKKVTIPLQGGVGTFVTFRGLQDHGEHFAITFGSYETNSAPVVRVHSECMTGDVFKSAKCDCGEQLEESIDKLNTHDGVLIYLRQEGRGIGLYNKLDAYELQGEGLDTYEANRSLGFGDDQRSYVVAAQMLKALGIRAVQLLTNNPDKQRQLEQSGISVVSVVSTGVFLKNENRRYLEAKVSRTGHKINLKGGGGAL